MKLSGWGRYPVLEARAHRPRSVEALRDLVLCEPNLIARGNGRAYGDSAVNPHATLDMRHFDRMLGFDSETGQMIGEAGVLLGDIVAVFLPRGWFPAITPGTKFVTLGGMIATDVHGKNHHRDGSFGSCVDWIDVMGADGEVRRCSRHEHSELFEWTLGGMGLTGVILRAAIRLRPVETGWIRQTTIPAKDLDAAMEAFEQAQDATYSVAWIDCLGSGQTLGRSLILRGEHARLADLDAKRGDRPFDTGVKRKLSVAVDCPSVALNRYTVRAFNAVYYWAGARKRDERIVDWDSFFYPLDWVAGWNGIYGRRGFAQFQCVLPLDQSRDGLIALLETTARAGAGSFLAVLKRFGKQDGGFSFPMEGYTLALDFPINHRTLELMKGLDRITIDRGGRFYLAKDSRMTAETLRAADPRTDAFVAMREDRGLRCRFRSAQSERLRL